MSIQFSPALDGPAYADQIPKWKDDERPQQYAAIAICTAAPTIAVAVRLYAQRVYRKAWGLDDLFIIVAMVCSPLPVWVDFTNSTPVYRLRRGCCILLSFASRSGFAPSSRAFR